MSELSISSQSRALLRLEKQNSAPGYDGVPAFIVEARGSKLWDIDGKEYIDFVSMFSAVNQGHSHPRIVEAIIAQMQKVHDSAGLMMCMRFGYDKIAPTVSGTDAVDAACKIARKWGITVKGIDAHDLLILGVAGCYHGLSTSMWSLQDRSDKRTAYGISDPHLRNTDPDTGEPLTYGDIECIKAVIEKHRSRIAAVVLECIRGHLPTLEDEIQYSCALFDICKMRNVLFIADEIRMGCGKTGTMMSYEHLGQNRQPDLVTLGKSITGGLYPASFVLGKATCMDLVESKEILSTYSFSPLAVVATTAALRVIDDEELIQRARLIETLFLEESSRWAKHTFISHVTARGGRLRGLVTGS